MADSAETFIRETLSRSGPDAEAPLPPPGPLPFRPEVFFIGRTEGAGLERDAFGNVTRRYHVTTEGWVGAPNDAIRLEEAFAYDDGATDIWRWSIRASSDGRYLAAEAKAGAGIAGERHGEDYTLAFHRPQGEAKGVLAPRFAARLTMLTPDLALKETRLSRFGFPIGSLTAFHRRV